MDNNEFKELYDKYNPLLSPMITKIIEDDYKFFQINEKIVWEFGYDANLTIMGTHSRETNRIALNLLSVIYAYENNIFLDVEYYIVHEVRHIFQQIKINEFDKDLIKQWKYEKDHYIKVHTDNGDINEEYFKQDVEVDAYAFALAVMKYKYGNIDLYVPDVYGNDFYEIVNWWIDHFKESFSNE